MIAFLRIGLGFRARARQRARFFRVEGLKTRVSGRVPGSAVVGPGEKQDINCIFLHCKLKKLMNSGLGPVSGLTLKSGPGSGFKIKFFYGKKKPGF